MDSLFEAWKNTSPKWNIRFQKDLFENFCNYGGGAKSSDKKGKKFGGAYELYIIAFFIGLYSKRLKELPSDSKFIKDFGVPMKDWGNFEREIAIKNYSRKNYNNLLLYIFLALIATTSDKIDLIKLDKGEITPKEIISVLNKQMEEYTNFGLQRIYEEYESDPSSLHRSSAFFDYFQSEFCSKQLDEEVPNLD